MNAQDVAVLKTVLVGVELPAEKAELLEYAVQQHAEPALLGALRSLPEREFESLDDVAEEILRAQPPRVEPDAQEPHEESGAPPGGDAYTDR